MTDERGPPPDDLRSGFHWRSIGRGLFASAIIRLFVRLGLLAAVGLILLVIGWYNG